MELIEAQDDGKIRGVVLVHSWPWFSLRERATDEAKLERSQISEFILELDFNTE